jgi:hypothetical protein
VRKPKSFTAIISRTERRGRTPRFKKFLPAFDLRVVPILDFYPPCGRRMEPIFVLCHDSFKVQTTNPPEQFTVTGFHMAGVH